jgi:hypothetical protein
MIDLPMLRTILITTICLALAGMNVAGTHLHFVGDDHSGHSRGVHADSDDAHLISVLDEHHDAEHHGEHEGGVGVDLDAVAKAFGKLPVAPLVVAAILFYILIALFRPMPGFRLRRAAPFRPPRRRSSVCFLPPSHAPPATAFTR